MSSSRDEIAMQILELAAKDAKVKDDLEKFGQEVVNYWRSVSPVRTGRYAASVEVLKTTRINGFPGVKVGSLSRRAALIEYGTGADDKVKTQNGVAEGFHYVKSLGVQVSNNTPTPAFAPRAKTAAHFGGDEKRVSEVNEIVQAQNESIAFGTSLSRDKLKNALDR